MHKPPASLAPAAPAAAAADADNSPFKPIHIVLAIVAYNTLFLAYNDLLGVIIYMVALCSAFMNYGFIVFVALILVTARTLLWGSVWTVLILIISNTVLLYYVWRAGVGIRQAAAAYSMKQQ